MINPLHLVAQAVARLHEVQVVALQVVALVADRVDHPRAHPAVPVVARLHEVPVVALQVVAQAVAQAVAHLHEVPVVALRVRAQVAHPSERALLVDYNRIHTPNPASRHPITNSTFRAFSCNFARSGVPEMTSATKTYHPPSVNIAMHAIIIRSPHEKSG